LLEAVIQQKTQPTPEGPADGSAAPEKDDDKGKKAGERVSASKEEYKVTNEVYAHSPCDV